MRSQHARVPPGTPVRVYIRLSCIIDPGSISTLLRHRKRLSISGTFPVYTTCVHKGVAMRCHFDDNDDVLITQIYGIFSSMTKK